MNCFVSGKALKKIIKSTYGALIVRGNIIAFYDPLFNELRVIEGCKPSIRGFLFVSYDFDRLKRLPENNVYELEAEDTSHLKIIDYLTGKTIDLIPGVLTKLP